MNLAMPVWNGRISPVFDTASRVMILNLEEGRERSRTIYNLSDEAFVQRARWIVKSKVDVLICGAISRPLAGMISQSGIKIIPSMAGDAEEILQAFIKGALPDQKFLMPGCCRRGRQGFKRKPGPYGRRRGGLS